jgi:hypothetical protein
MSSRASNIELAICLVIILVAILASWIEDHNKHKNGTPSPSPVGKIMPLTLTEPIVESKTKTYVIPNNDATIITKEYIEQFCKENPSVCANNKEIGTMAQWIVDPPHVYDRVITIGEGLTEDCDKIKDLCWTCDHGRGARKIEGGVEVRP